MSLLPPDEFRHGPFTVAQARASGIKWEQLQTKRWRRMSRGQYSWTGLTHGVELMLRAVARRLPERAAFSGNTGAWMHGADFSPCQPIEVTVPRDLPVRARAGVKLRRASLAEGDVVMRHGFRVTTRLRTACDLGSQPDLVEATVALDMFLHAGIVDLRALTHYVDNNAGTKGIKRLRRAVAVAESRSESPMETRLRLALLKGRLPRPCVQVDLCDASGRFLGRVDLYYPDVRLVIEFDGQDHKERLAADLKRQNALLNAGYRVLRFTASDFRAPDAIAAQVSQARAALTRNLG
jgi:very-short-patch-repair endonuclease